MRFDASGPLHTAKEASLFYAPSTSSVVCSYGAISEDIVDAAVLLVGEAWDHAIALYLYPAAC
eukprot:4333059-Amphidinium_carterae.1